MWEDIFRQNKENVLKAVDLFEIELQHLKQAIKNDRWDEVNARMKDANKLHDIL